jgi:hypothetical protein
VDIRVGTAFEQHPDERYIDPVGSVVECGEAELVDGVFYSSSTADRPAIPQIHAVPRSGTATLQRNAEVVMCLELQAF